MAIHIVLRLVGVLGLLTINGGSAVSGASPGSTTLLDVHENNLDAYLGGHEDYTKVSIV